MQSYIQRPLRRSLAAVAVLSVTLASAACSDDDDDPIAPETPGTIVEVASATTTFDTLVAAIEAAGLTSTLNGPGPFTVFAPTDEAFAKLPEGTIEALLADPAALSSILTYHVVAGRVPASEVVQLTSATTVNGSPVTIDASGDTVRINDATVIAADVPASNGVIHVIDAVLLPPQ
ncbi:MAG TPA: fasciclin domain-containing protein [Gemmatimonadaceae bacterium]|nr:fasciclin domain-containing protein [Gemmatimonadaceae bacterium]